MPRGGGSFEKCFAWEETNDLPGYQGEGEVFLGDCGVGGNYRDYS